MIKQVILAFCTASLAGCYTPPVVETAPQMSGNYELDPAHTSVVWRVSHAGLSNYTARFDIIEGTLSFDAEAVEQSRVDVRIDPTSVNTGLSDFDETIATGARYFDADRFQEIRFISTSVTRSGEANGTVTGDLTFRGVTRPITLNVKFNGAGKSFGNPGETLGFSATTEITRSDFGMTYLKNFGIGDIVSIHIETEFNEVQ